MYDLSFTAEQTEMQQAVRDFVRDEVEPVVRHSRYLEDRAYPLPVDLVAQASALGLRTLGLPEELGGAGADALTACLVMEELGAGDAGIAVTLAHTAMLGTALFGGALNAEQRDRYLPAFQSDDRFHIASVDDTDDPDRDLEYHGRDRPGRAPGVRAVRGADGSWTLDGSTPFSENVPVAKLIVLCVADGRGGRCAMLVTPDMTGVTIESRDIVTGDPRGGASVRRWTHGTSGRLVLAGCRVPAAQIAGEPSTALRDAMSARWSHPAFCAINVGVGRAALDAAVDYAKLRIQGGRRIVEHQAIGEILADCAIRLEAARNLVWKAAWTRDRGTPGGSIQHIAHVYTAEAIHRLTLKAAECFGAMGVMLDMPLTRFVRDARIFLHAGRSGSAGRFRIAEALAGYGPA